MIVTLRARSGTAAQWTAANPVLTDGEIGHERDTHQFKMGDGSTVWTSLPYAGGAGGGSVPLGVLVEGGDVDLDAVDEYLLHMRILNDGSDTTNWPNRMEFSFKPDPATTIGEHLTAWFNEYGEFRVTPAKVNTVPFRAFTKELSTDEEHADDVPVMEMVWSRQTRTPIWGVMADGTMYTAGPIERRVPSGPILSSGHLVLAAADSIPAGTPEGTLIVRI